MSTVYDEAQKERIKRNLAKLKEVRFRITPELYDSYLEAVKIGGYRSMRQFMMTAADNLIKQDLERLSAEFEEQKKEEELLFKDVEKRY